MINVFLVAEAAGRRSRHPELGSVELSVDSDAAHYAVSVVDEAGASRLCALFLISAASHYILLLIHSPY
jgi:hypothetical protein